MTSESWLGNQHVFNDAKCQVMGCLCGKNKNENDEAVNDPSTNINAQSQNSASAGESVLTLDRAASFRRKLPAFRDERGISIWGLLRQAIGKDVSKISMPVQINEPLSFLQRVAEYVEYSHVIDQANLCEDPVERMEYVSAFLVSALSSSYKRRFKPFNPVLGETFEFDRPDLGFRWLSEQVSHHPPISAFHCEGTRNGGFAFYGSIQPKVRFTGRQLDVTPKGIIRLKLHKYEELYKGIQTESFHLVVHNLLSKQETWLQHKGVLHLNKTPGTIKCNLDFKQWEGNHHFVEGSVLDGDVLKRMLYGSWIINMYSCDPKCYEEFKSSGRNKEYVKNFLKKMKENKKASVKKSSLMTFDFETPKRKTLWMGQEKVDVNDKYYNFGKYTMSLNEIAPGMEQTLPQSDSRWRKDMRLMEEGQFDAAQEQKNRIEEKQRAIRAEREKNKEVYKPKWFEEKMEEEWIFTHKYWKLKNKDSTFIFQ